MKILNDYLSNRNNLWGLSIGLTAAAMLILFLLFQILAFAGLTDLRQLKENKMVVHEVIKLKFTTEKSTAPKSFRKASSSSKKTRPSVSRKKKKAETVSKSIERLVDGFDVSRLLSRKSSRAKSGRGQRMATRASGISTDVEPSKSRHVKDNLVEQLGRGPGLTMVTRRSLGGRGAGSRIGTGSGRRSGPGAGTEDGDVSVGWGRSSVRSVKGGGKGGGGSIITLPSGVGGDEAALDIHALIKWMKAHPGPIPRLVAHDMGHRTGDLSSAVAFALNGKKYQLYLSCNEQELLLRICLIEGNDFTLLKDNGIRESSNFLTIGDVVRRNKKIQSLISSREAPGDRAEAFYRIFWSWWQQQQPV